MADLSAELNESWKNTPNTVKIWLATTSLTSATTIGLYNVLQIQQLKSFRDVYYTHEYKNQRDVIDHILVSEDFFENSGDRKWALSDVRIWNDHIDDYQDAESDHGVIKAEFVSST